MNQRVAAHKGRKLIAVPASETNGAARHGASERAAAAAARVAARYAKTPSYSEQLAGEARAAVRAAEAVSLAAQEAQAAAESVLAGIEAAVAAEPVWEVRTSAVDVSEPEPSLAAEEQVAGAAAPQAEQRAAWMSVAEEREDRWEPQARPAERVASAVVQVDAAEQIPAAAENRWTQEWGEPESGEIEMVEPAQPIHANLIEFPREIVATRKVRPRLAEGPLATAEDQLSIFEVDPSTISTEPAASGAAVGAAAGWTAPVWSSIELDATPAREFYEAPQAEVEPVVAEPTAAERAVQARPQPTTAVESAPVHLRVMAALVDGSLVMCALLGAAVLAGASVREVPSVHATEAMVAIGLVVICGFYHVLFYGFARRTPGMHYAGIAPCTFDGRGLSRWHRMGRLVTMGIAVAPLGLVWAMIDGEGLSWHDRMSGSYLRKV